MLKQEKNSEGRLHQSELYTLKWSPYFKNLLLDSNNSSEALKSLCSFQKSINKHFTLEYFARRLGMSSRSCLSEIINGKRILHKKYTAVLTSAFNLKKIEGEILEHLVFLDHAKDEQLQSKIASKLRVYRKKLETSKKRLPSSLMNEPFSFMVFSAFGFFGHSATIDQFSKFFGKEQLGKIQRSLRILRNIGFVDFDGKLYTLSNKAITFKSSENGYSHIQFLKQSMMDARNRVEELFDKEKESFFSSMIVSVKKDEFIKFLVDYRKQHESTLDKLDSDDADTLIRFNIQAYTVGTRKSED